MTLLSQIFLTSLVFFAALLYSSVGHGGASGYLAAMALVGMSPVLMKPTALSLNILVALIATFKFARAKLFSWRIFWPFVVTSAPFAFLGGSLTLPGTWYKVVVGLVLVFAGFRLLQTSKAAAGETRPVPIPLALFLGVAIGLLSGLTGVGGGIFLSPLLLLTGWAEPKTTAGVSAAFILANSVAGLLGHLASVQTLPASIAPLAIAAVAGGWIGSTYGSRRIGSTQIRRLLAVVLLIAGMKMIFL